MPTLCRDCFAELAEAPVRRCPHCGQTRLKSHPELSTLSIAHVDCDAFYASVEKRDQPELKNKPVIVGGGHRGVVSAACYVARSFGVRSAMPMFKALKACPQAVVIRPDMRKYAEVSRQVRELMTTLTPMVEPLSLDEAFLDLTGTTRLHRRDPCQSLAVLALSIEQQLGITVSIGLSYNKFLAKIASDLDKPRGFALIGKAEAQDFLGTLPVTVLPGVGPRMAQSLGRANILSIADLQQTDETILLRMIGPTASWLCALARGEDARRVLPHSDRKTISAETTLFNDLSKLSDLTPILWDLCERVSARAKGQSIGGRTIVLKVKTGLFQSQSRRMQAPDPTQSADVLYRCGLSLLSPLIDGTAYRLIGIGLTDLVSADQCDLPGLFDQSAAKRLHAERAIDQVRAKFGAKAIVKGRSLR